MNTDYIKLPDCKKGYLYEGLCEAYAEIHKLREEIRRLNAMIDGAYL